MNINRTYRLTPDQYFDQPFLKRHIYLHHTVSGSWTSVWDWWNEDPQRIGTAFVVDKDGTIYEIFEPACWAHHIGSKAPGNIEANQESIGIEIVSEGALDRHHGEWFWFADKIRYRSSTKHIVDLQEPWRDVRFFDGYDEPQIQALCDLLPRLCDEFSIKRRLLLPQGERNEFHPELLTSYETGILTHCNVREDKTDVHPGFPWKRIEEALAG